MATFTVTNTNDAGPGSLRQAVQDANAAPGADLVTFALAPGATIRLVQGEIAITDELAIDGDLDDDRTPDITITGDVLGNDVITGDGFTDVVPSLEAALLDDNVRIFNSSAVTTITGLSLTGGRFVSSDFRADGGGAITGGGGSYYSQNTLTINDSVIRGNSTAGQNVSGGGVFQLLDDLVVTNSDISDNHTTGSGGGISGGGVTVAGSTIDGNISLQQGLDGGGGIQASSLDIVNSSVSGNSAAGRGGGIDAGYVTATNLTVAGNFGGGIAGGGLRITNSTITGNTLYGVAGDGAGIFSFAYLTLDNSILLGNAAGYYFSDFFPDGPVFEPDEFGTDGSTLFVEINNSIVGPDASVFDTSPYPSARNALAAEVFAQTAEAMADTDRDGVLDTGAGIFGGRLAENGGPVGTVALLNSDTNPAIDTGNDQLFDAPFAVDARGLSRFVDRPGIGADGGEGAGIIDLGAFEFAGEVIAPCPGTPVTAETAELLAFVYEALLNRDGAIDAAGFNFWIDALEGALPDQGAPLSLQEMVDFFFTSPEFIESFGDVAGLTPRQIVELFYLNVLDRPGDPEGVEFWTTILENSGLSNADVLIEFADAPENRQNLDITVIDNGDCTWSVDVLLL